MNENMAFAALEYLKLGFKPLRCRLGRRAKA